MSGLRRAAGMAVMSALALAAAGCGKSGDDVAKTKQGEASAQARSGQAGVTPMAERVAVLGVLNKRNGIVRDVALRPGQSARWKDMIVRLRACERTAPWEPEKLTGAFIQVDVQRPDDSWGRVFSGWVYRESPSLNVVEHAVYDVWVKNCEMTFPEGEPAPASDASSRRSSAANSGGGSGSSAPPTQAPTEPPATEAPPIAAESNAA